MTKTKILIGTNNQHKIQEIQHILPEFTLVTPASLGIDLEVDETGATFAENAALKARAFCQASGLITIADDSGLEVDALGGEPGVHSHRYCPKPGATDADRRAYLIQNLQGKPQPWTARFRCAAALCFPSEAGCTAVDDIVVVDGTVEGQVIAEERGAGGFGYDCIFYVPERGKTLSELSEQEKNEISHRGNAMKKLRPLLEKRMAG